MHPYEIAATRATANACSLVLRDPKPYLVAAEMDSATGKVASVPKVFSLDRFESLTLSSWRNDAAPTDLDAFVAAGRLVAPARGRSCAGAPELNYLTLCIHELDATGNSALLSDARAYPLAADQTIVIAADRGSATLEMYRPACDRSTDMLDTWARGPDRDP